MATLDDVDRILCLTGPESTGKTTLLAALAESLSAATVPEVARDYLTGRAGYGPEDLLEILRLQSEAERSARSRHRGVLVCDTDCLVLAVWWREKWGALPDPLAAAMEDRSPRGYLLLAPDLPWEPDPLRESPRDRKRLFDVYSAELAGGDYPYRVVSGEGPARGENAQRAAEELLAELAGR